MQGLEECLMSLKESFVKKAEERARTLVCDVENGLKLNNYDLNAYAPMPKSTDREYHVKHAKRTMVRNLVKSERFVLRPTDPNIVKMNQKAVDKFVSDAIQDAEHSFGLFLQKMKEKIGDCDSCELSGDSLWNYSILTVKKEGTVEKWKTQQIINVSKHGKLFNQFPSRKLK